MIKTALAQALDLGTALGGTGILGGYSVNDIFKWAIDIGGGAALGVLIFGGVMYISSAGNSSRQGDAKEWIKAAIYGLILLAVGYLILNTINPAILGQ